MQKAVEHGYLFLWMMEMTAHMDPKDWETMTRYGAEQTCGFPTQYNLKQASLRSDKALLFAPLLQ